MNSLLMQVVLITTTVCGIIDLVKREIPNYLTIPLFVAGIVYNMWSGNIKMALIGAAIGFTVGFLGFAANGAGGGDLKLLTAIGAWFGTQLIDIIVVSSVFGILYAAFFHKKEIVERVKSTVMGGYLTLIFNVKGAWKSWEGKTPIEVPYGTCLALAVWVEVIWRGVAN